MPGIVSLVAAISADVAVGLAAAGYPALTDGAILLGQQHLVEQSAPPRIIFIPKSSAFSVPSPASASNVSTNTPYSTEGRRQIAQRSIATDSVTFEVRCWGSSIPADPNNDFDVTQALYQQVIASAHVLCAGAYKVGNGAWTDTSQLFRDGREFVFSLTLATPVLGTLLSRAPSDVHAVPTTTLTLRQGGTEQGCSG